ncbi:MBL fold metallo-hydrolase [Streptomyces nitrosporeus]|uniref:MBL fold metallo-hydrolase n=1 Tax=Streptomyces nitrosporeus TaxID=28894 RepID=A0A5J6FH30_9ACTN|nr:ferredoxin [Streptomyces nitrosporeus]QEU75137.1 MBL fold metallo-hydrolase [Streptomyces nitrosporeus]GGY90491.1 MBL fold metallo-hydrolase [Streptomyces nitrosporeus]
MARRDRRHPENVAGDWFVDDRCIGCGGSVSLAPTLFGPASDGEHFVMTRQPATEGEILQAQLAAEVCPSRSIGTESGVTWRRHHPLEITPGTWRTGSNSPGTAGGNAFLVQRAEGNLLVDAPRFTPSLCAWMESLGGITTILLTHRDDVGDAERYADAFGSQVVIHAADAEAAPFAGRILRGVETCEVAVGVLAIPTPGHTEGHVMYLNDDGTLFTGDSLGWDPYRHDLGAEPSVCWYSWPAQVGSLQRLDGFNFARVVPTHGTMSPTLEPGDMRRRLQALVARLQRDLADE